MIFSENQELDFKKYFVEKGEIGFSPDRNKAIVEGSIRKYEKMREERNKDYTQQVRERADAVVTYLKHLDAGHFTSVETYFGRKELARLQGQRIVGKMQSLINNKKIITLDEV